MDFVFGTLINDQLKVASHRAERMGIQHGNVIQPLDPEPGQAVMVSVRTGSDVLIDHVALYFTVDGSDPAGSRGVAHMGQAIPLQRTQLEWDTLTWGYLTTWQATIPPQTENVMVRYCISGWSDAGTEIYADWPHVGEIVEHAAQVYFNNAPPRPDWRPGNPSAGKIFAYHVDRTNVPVWARNAVIYHIFVDRFFPGQGKDWIQTTDLSGFCGGTLWGVLEKLDYLDDLGVTCIWLSPTWVSPTAHGYDVCDYNHVEPRLGGDQALHALVKAAHSRGIRVLLDMACNHLSSQHPIFQDALNNPASRYRPWFIFDDSQLGYKSFFGVSSMPDMNYANPEARDWMIEIAQHWLRDFEIDGYRLDYANGPGPDFWTYFRVACKETNPDCLLFGEIIDSPDKLLRYAGRLDGSLNFQVNDALRRTFAWKSWSNAQLDSFLRDHRQYFPETFVMPTFLDNHDMDRFSFIAKNNSDALKQAAKVQMSLPEPAIIYYGTEVGLKQKQSTRDFGLHLSRELMVWDDQQDGDLLAFYRELIKTRK